MNASTNSLPRVAIIAGAADTIDGLSAYFARVGVIADALSLPLEPGALPEAVTAAVVFPDDFDTGDVIAFLASLRAARPGLLVVVVTSAPRSFSAAVEADDHTPPGIVLQRPAFGWAILDAIRSAAAWRTA